MTADGCPASDRIQLLDGGTGSELRRRGVSLSDRCWSGSANLDRSELLYDIHADYIRAGADIVTANTFGTARFVLADAGLDRHFDEVNAAAIAAAQRAAESSARDVCVAASLSCLAPGFDKRAFPDSDIEFRAYSELCETFVEQRIDLILLEMMQDTKHAPLACRAALSSGLPFWIGISCRVDDSGDRLVAYDDTEQSLTPVIENLLAFEPAGIAIMHSPVDAIGRAIDELRRQWHGPIGAYAEIPYPEDPKWNGNQIVSPEDYATEAGRWIAQGASLVGGCCGTTPAHIEALKAVRDAQ